MTDRWELSKDLRRELLRFLGASSSERAELISELTTRNPAMGELLIDLESDNELRARFEMELLQCESTEG